MASLLIQQLLPAILKQNGIHDTVANIKISTPDLNGEHMLSTIETVQVEFKSIDPMHFFVKNRLRFPNSKEQDDRMKFITENEGSFLTETISDMATMCRNLGAPNLLDGLFPTVYHGDQDRIVMEDLSKRDYGILPKTKRQDFEQARLVIERLARFHAVSFVYLEREGGIQSFLAKNPRMEPNLSKPGGKAMMKNVFEPIYAKILHMLKISKLPQAKDAYEVLKAFAGKLGDTLGDIVESKTSFYTICHGDVWNNNILFSKDGQDLVFVDLQLVQVGSPNLDLGCFLFTSAQKEVRLRWKELLQIYLSIFEDRVASLGHAVKCSFEEFVEDYRRKSKLGFLFGVFSTIVFEDVPGSSSDKDEFSGFEKWLHENPEKADGMSQFLVDLVEEFTQVCI